LTRNGARRAGLFVVMATAGEGRNESLARIVAA
jgi:hypothetical protein